MGQGVVYIGGHCQVQVAGGWGTNKEQYERWRQRFGLGGWKIEDKKGAYWEAGAIGKE